MLIPNLLRGDAICRRRKPGAAPDAAGASKQGEDGDGEESRAGLEQVQESASRALEDLVVQLENSVDNQVRPCTTKKSCLAFSSSSSLFCVLDCFVRFLQSGCRFTVSFLFAT